MSDVQQAIQDSDLSNQITTCPVCVVKTSNDNYLWIEKRVQYWTSLSLDSNQVPISLSSLSEEERLMYMAVNTRHAPLSQLQQFIYKHSKQEHTIGKWQGEIRLVGKRVFFVLCDLEWTNEQTMRFFLMDLAAKAA